GTVAPYIRAPYVSRMRPPCRIAFRRRRALSADNLRAHGMGEGTMSNRFWQPNMKVRNATLGAIILVAGTLASAAASATTITFSGLTGANVTPVATYTEGGFTVTTTVGQFFQEQNFGNPIPSLLAGPAGGGPVNDALEVFANGGGLFNFVSVDLAAN